MKWSKIIFSSHVRQLTSPPTAPTTCDTIRRIFRTHPVHGLRETLWKSPIKTRILRPDPSAKPSRDPRNHPAHGLVSRPPPSADAAETQCRQINDPRYQWKHDSLLILVFFPPTLREPQSDATGAAYAPWSVRRRRTEFEGGREYAIRTRSDENLHYDKRVLIPKFRPRPSAAPERRLPVRWRFFFSDTADPSYRWKSRQSIPFGSRKVSLN